MLKITGVILCIMGCAGYGMLKVSTWNKAITELEQWILLFQKMKSQIHYQREIIEEICIHMNQDVYGIGGKYAALIGELSYRERTKGFAEIWKEQMMLWKKESSIPANIKKIIQDFPEYIGEQDYELQIGFLDLFISNLIREKDTLEKQLYEKKKPVMAVSFIGGMVISILLL